MSTIINSYQLTVGTREFQLVDVSRSSGSVGVADITEPAYNPYGQIPTTELLYVNDEAIINLTRPPRGDDFTDKTINQISTISVCDDNIKTVLATASDNYFTYSYSMLRSLYPVFELLCEGIYVCHEAKMIPGNGAGGFFWNSYLQRHIMAGSANYNRVMGRESNYTPCFLVPTINPSEFSEAKVKTQCEKLNAEKRIGGIAYHLSGMFSALLDGHHSSVACLLNDVDFRCIVIEPIKDMLYETEAEASVYGREPKVIALSCPYVKIPLDQIPPPMLESFLLRRNGTRPKHYARIKKNAGKILRIVGKKVLPREIMIKAEFLPNHAAIESAHAITELTDEQLDALIAGETTYDDKIIISKNHYNSIITACNYLQFEDFDRFLSFSFSIFNNPDLKDTHKYILERLYSINNKRVYEFFKNAVDNRDPAHEEYYAQFETYVKSYEKVATDSLIDKENKAKKLNRAIGLLGAEMNEAGIAQMEAIVKASRRG